MDIYATHYHEFFFSFGTKLSLRFTFTSMVFYDSSNITFFKIVFQYSNYPTKIVEFKKLVIGHSYNR